ncbi:MAG TPA: hypothetical protein VL404_08715 [Candidatus Eisenbacteria bacterium]|nr:hypothetical protein [Candidatus Eisenbacteria bacterium]
MGIMRKLIVGSLAVGAARMAMESKGVKKAGRSTARAVRRVARPALKAAAAAGIAEAVRSGSRGTRKRASSARRPHARVSRAKA